MPHQGASISNKRRIFGFLTLGFVVLVGLSAAVSYAAYALVEGHLEQKNEQARSRLYDEQAKVGSITNPGFDPRDEGELVRNSEEVFVGRVEELVSREEKPTTLITGYSSRAQFTVRVLEVVKDDAGEEGQLEQGKVATVSQLGVPPEDAEATVNLANFSGQKSDPKENRERIPAEQLEPGTAYVFATEYDSWEGWHEVRVHPFGWMVLGSEEDPEPLDTPQVRELGDL